MFKELRTYLLIGAALGVSYTAYTKLTSPPVLNLGMTRKIMQQIKHQMLIVTINFAEGISKHTKSGGVGDKANMDKIKQYFISELTKIYEQKQQLILSKYSVNKQCYSHSLEKYKSDKNISLNQAEIINMMQRAVDGQTPDLKINEIAYNTFSKNQVKKVYTDMCKLVSTKVTEKLQQQKAQNPYFDPTDDANFRKAIRKLSIYDMKVDFLRSRGFKDEWGCPNEVFFKLSESLKIKDPQFKGLMVKIEKAYERVIEIVSKNPDDMKITDIDKYFEQKKNDQVRITKSLNLENSNQQKIQKKLSKSMSAEAQNNVIPPQKSEQIVDQKISQPPQQISEPLQQEQDIKAQTVPQVNQNIQQTYQIELQPQESKPQESQPQECKPEQSQQSQLQDQNKQEVQESQQKQEAQLNYQQQQNNQQNQKDQPVNDQNVDQQAQVVEENDISQEQVQAKSEQKEVNQQEN